MIFTALASMEFSFLKQLYSAENASAVALLILSYCLLLKWKKTDSSKKHPPEPSGSWPVIGHLHLLGELPHKSLGKMADKYGPIFMMKLGVQRALVVSSHAMAKECLGDNDRVFVDRPQTLFVKHLAYNSAIFGFSNYGQHWREMRKIATVELLSNRRVEMLKHVRVSEINLAIKEIYGRYQVNRNSEVLDMKRWFNDISINSSVKLIAGKNLREMYQGEKYDRISQALRDFFQLAGTFVPADALPFLRWLDIGGYEKIMKKVAAEIDEAAQEWLEDHKRRLVPRERNEKQDFLDVMLGLYETGQDTPTEFGPDVIIKANCMTIILAATDTTAVTLTWALSLLLNNRDAMQKAQAELNTLVEKQRQVNDSDLKDLTYLEAIIKETLRLYPAGPLSVPRAAAEDCTVSGYHISAGTRLLVNLYKIQRDPEVWPNPLEFQPERFLTTHKNYDGRGHNFAYIPFGSGRRICPGITYAFKSMMLTLASLLHGFEMSTATDKPIDMTESLGLSNLKATPLEVILIPRLPHHIYSLPATENTEVIS